MVLGIRDEKVQERLLRFSDLTLQKAIDICKAAEQTSQKLKLMSNVTKDSVVLLDKSAENHVIHLSVQNSDSVGPIMEIASTLHMDRPATRVAKRTILSRSADQAQYK